MANTVSIPSPYATLSEAWAASPIYHRCRERAAAGERPSENLWHRHHEHYLNFVVPLLPRCSICGGVVETYSWLVRPGDNLHERCRLRREAGRPMQQEDGIRKCPCATCNPVAWDSSLDR